MVVNRNQTPCRTLFTITHAFPTKSSRMATLYQPVAPYHRWARFARQNRGAFDWELKHCHANFSTPSQNYVLVRPIKGGSAGNGAPRFDTKNSFPSFQLTSLWMRTLWCLIIIREVSCKRKFFIVSLNIRQFAYILYPNIRVSVLISALTPVPFMLVHR